MDRIRAVVVPVFLAHVALFVVFLAVEPPLQAASWTWIETGRASCAPYAGGPPRLIEGGGAVVAGRDARHPWSWPFLGPWPDFVTAFVVPGCTLRTPPPGALQPTRGESYTVAVLSLTVGTTFWSMVAFAAAAAVHHVRRHAFPARAVRSR